MKTQLDLTKCILLTSYGDDREKSCMRSSFKTKVPKGVTAVELGKGGELFYIPSYRKFLDELGKFNLFCFNLM